MPNPNVENENVNGSLPTAAESTEQPITGLDAARTFGEFAAALKGLPSSKLLEYRLAMLRRAITPAMSEEKPMLCETPQTTNQEERLKELAKWEARLELLTEMVDEFEKFDELVKLRIFGGGNRKERNERERRYRLLEYQLFGADDWCAAGMFDKELEDVRSSVMELGVDCDEVKELLRRIDAVAENMSDE